MPSRYFRLCAAVAGVLAIALCAPALALESGWQGEFSSSVAEPTDPQSPLRIKLPDDIDPATLEWLAVELDTMDVTPILTMEGAEVVVRPPRPLASGTHRLTLAQYNEAGEVVERGSWTFKVGQAIAYQVRADAGFAATYRAETKNIPEESLPSHPGTADATLRLEGSAGTPFWEVSGNADGLWSNQPAQGLDRFEGGNYLATVRVGGVTAQVGQVDPRLESPIIGAFQRRGVSLGYTNAGQQVQASGFALRTEPVTGFKHGLGIGDPEKRVLGGSLTLRPIPQHAEWLTLTGIYLVGKQGTDPGLGVADETAFSDGSAWSLGFVSGLAGQRLRLRGEYAATQFDPDGAGEQKATPDKAYGAAAILDLLRDLKLAEMPVVWSIGGEYRSTGSSFKSLANAGLPNDLQMQKGFTRVELGGLSAEAVAGREHDNIEDDPAVATGRTDLMGALVAYSPTLTPGGWAQGVLGQPRLDLGYQELRDRTIQLPEGTTEKPDKRNREWSAALGSAYTIWDWKGSYRSRREVDLTGVAADRTSESADGNLGLRLWERITLGLRGQYTREKDLGTGLTRTGTLIGGDLTLVLVKDYLTARVAHQNDIKKASDNSESMVTQTTDFSLDLALRQARDNWPGIALNLKGQQQKVDDRLTNENDKNPFQVFLAVNIGWPVSAAGTWR